RRHVVEPEALDLPFAKLVDPRGERNPPVSRAMVLRENQGAQRLERVASIAVEVLERGHVMHAVHDHPASGVVPVAALALRVGPRVTVADHAVTPTSL